MKNKFTLLAFTAILTSLLSCEGNETPEKAPEKIQDEISAEDAALEKEFEKLDEDVQTIEDTLN